MTPTSFFLERALQFTPDYYFHPGHIALAKTWGIVVWERWMAWNDAYCRGRQRLRYIVPQLRPKAAFLLEEARWAGFAFWVWDGLSAAPLLGDTSNLRLWIINQSNVLRDIAKCPPRWLNRRDKLSISSEDVALLNLMWPLLNRMTLPLSVWIRWQDVLVLASCQQWFEPRSMVEADPVRRNVLNGGLLREAVSERAYYAALIRITWEGIRNVATEEPETTVTWPEEPKPPADNEAARRSLDTALSWCDRWHAALSDKMPGADSTTYPPGEGPHRIDKLPGDGTSDKTSRRMTIAEANKKACQLAKDRRTAFFLLSEREQARKIGCSWQTWSRTPLYEKAKQSKTLLLSKGARDKTPPSPPVASLTSDLEAVTGEGEPNVVLNQLIREQEADYEPSPLENDAPECRPRKIHTRKRL